MYHYLRHHPEVAMSMRKEPHYFSSDLEDPEFITGLDKYLALFSQAADEAVVGEGSVWYMFSSVAAERLRDFNRDARMIAILRDPIEAVPSIFWHHVYTGFQANDDFEAVYLSRRDQNGISQPQGRPDSFRQVLDYSRVARYGDQLERFYRQFPREQMYVLLLEDMKTDPVTVYKAVTEFLEIDPGYMPEFARHNVQRRFRSRALAQSMWRAQAATARSSVPQGMLARNLRRIQTRSVRLLSGLNSEPFRRPELSPRMRAMMISDYRSDVAKLSELIGRDLSNWLA